MTLDLLRRVRDTLHAYIGDGGLVAELDAALAEPTGMPEEPDATLLLDNAAVCSQVREMLEDDRGVESPLRECVRLNVCKPMKLYADRWRAYALALKADAERYRALRHDELDEIFICVRQEHTLVKFTGTAADAAIDAAIAGKAGGTK